MFKGLFSAKTTTRQDVVLAVVTAVFAIGKAVETTNKYKAEQKARNDKELTS
jgi:hypothetical protein